MVHLENYTITEEKQTILCSFKKMQSITGQTPGPWK